MEAAAANAKLTTRDCTYIALCAALMAVCSWISFPLGEVPVTLQTLGVFLTVGLLGGRRGTLSILVFLLLAAVGAPVLAGFTGGLGVVLGYTGGYLLGFLCISLVMWGAERLAPDGHLRVAAMLLGLVLCYAFGTAWYAFLYAREAGSASVWTILGWCVFPYVIPDLVKLALALALTARLRRYVR